ncbi:MAG: hypothetical protein ABH849_02725 [Nanoarchaeota archaeon]
MPTKTQWTLGTLAAAALMITGGCINSFINSPRELVAADVAGNNTVDITALSLFGQYTVFERDTNGLYGPSDEVRDPEIKEEIKKAILRAKGYYTGR